MTQLTKVDIIKETVEYYTKNPRAVKDDGTCCYYDEQTGNQCAIGRCLVDPKILANLDTCAQLLVESGVEFKEQYRHIDDEYFWQDLQELHDGDGNWIQFDDGSNKLSIAGQEAFQDMLVEYADQ